MTDPVSRAAKRQNLIDAIAEHLTDWGCPTDTAATRAGGLLLLAEQHGWTLPTVVAPPLTGRGSTDEGRARARRIMANARAGCTCSPSAPGWLQAQPAGMHPRGCPVRDAYDSATAQGATPC
jgi:hypothetical protein